MRRVADNGGPFKKRKFTADEALVDKWLQAGCNTQALTERLSTELGDKAPSRPTLSRRLREYLGPRAMAELRSSRTSFVIAHRLSTIRDADTILVMEQGRIKERGRHDELLQAQGLYWKHWSLQNRLLSNA